jgi:hypothetical protein
MPSLRVQVCHIGWALAGFEGGGCYTYTCWLTTRVAVPSEIGTNGQKLGVCTPVPTLVPVAYALVYSTTVLLVLV